MAPLGDPTDLESGAAEPPQGVDEEALDEQASPAEAPPTAGESGAVTTALDDAETATGELEVVAVPVAELALTKRRVSGRYRSGDLAHQLELRVDVDGVRPMNRVSGDFFQIAGRTTSYLGSFVVDAPSVTTTATSVRIEGPGRFTWRAIAPVVRVTIPRVAPSAPPGQATVQFLTTQRTPKSAFLCSFLSSFFRTIEWEQDSVAGAVPFISYDTASLPQPAGSPARVLSVAEAFAEAGLELQVAGTPNVIPVDLSGADRKWSDSELHNAMVGHFSFFADAPQWRLWLLVATSHAGGARGIMFDYSGAFQRQGCAVFYDAIKGTDPQNQRAQLRTYVHELGHAFNLLHSWEKHLADPPQPLGPNGGLGDLSWMNYAWRYQPAPPAPGGDAAYWSAFPFQFTDNELVHLRHGFYRHVIMGANTFGKSGADVDPGVFDDPLIDDSRLELELRAKEAFEYGEPVVVELKLSTTDKRGVEAHGYLHPNDDFVTIGIQQPSGRTVAFRPLLRRCVDVETTVRLDEKLPAIYDSAYIGYGRDGFYFDQPGQYDLRAHYVANDGSRVISQVLRIRIRPPASREDTEVAELLMGDQQGQLFALLGSDSETLRAGNEALQRVIDEHSDHPLAVYARLVKGVNAQRDFKNLTPDKELEIRPAEPQESIDLLTPVAEASVGDEGVDNITLDLVMQTMADAEVKAGRPEQAFEVMDRMVEVFTEKGVNPHVLEGITERAETTKAEIRELEG